MKKQKPLTEMTLKGLEDATRDLDGEFVIDSFGPMTPEAIASWERARRKRGAKKGASKTVSVSIDAQLLRRADTLAKRLRVSRSRLLATGLERVLEVSERSATKRRNKKPAA